MSHFHENDVHIGPGGQRSERPPIIVEAEEERRITGTHNGGVCVHDGGTGVISMSAVHNGSLRVEKGARAVVRGTHNGSLTVSEGGSAEIYGRQNGSITVHRGGVVRIAERGAAAGSIHVEGRVENAGKRGGSVSGGGDLVDLPGAVVVPPTIKNGSNYYTF